MIVDANGNQMQLVLTSISVTITQNEKQDIINFLKKQVDKWCNTTPNKKFGLADLVGTHKTNWTSTPLLVLYNKHSNKGYPKSEKYAAMDAGLLLKETIYDDARNFKIHKDEKIVEDGNIVEVNRYLLY